MRIVNVLVKCARRIYDLDLPNLVLTERVVEVVVSVERAPIVDGTCDSKSPKSVSNKGVVVVVVAVEGARIVVLDSGHVRNEGG